VGKDGTPGGIDSENIYIEGDNLDALKLLQETYLGKVKMIYIEISLSVLIKKFSAPQTVKTA
jgi:adenine specific DNA methylase Mod